MTTLSTAPPTPLLARPKHMAYGDAVRVLGTVAVVVGHVADLPMAKVAPDTLDWWMCNIANSIARWAVPVYIMLSGALLLDPARKESASVFYRKRLARLGAPLVFWSAFFILFEVYYLGPAWDASWSRSLQNLALGQPYPHLHFIFRIAVLYAFTPMFRVFVRHAPRKMLVSTVIILFAVWSADSVINAFMGTSLSALARFAPFVSFYLAGYLLRESYAAPGQLKWYVIALLACATLLAVITGVLCMTLGFAWYPSVPLMLYDFLSPVRVPMAICAWIILITIFRENSPALRKTGKWFAILAPTTLGLYLIHPAFREVLYSPYTLRDLLANIPGFGFMWHWNSLDPLWPTAAIGIPIMASVVYLLSLGAVMLMMRIPFVRRVVE